MEARTVLYIVLPLRGGGGIKRGHGDTFAHAPGPGDNAKMTCSPSPTEDSGTDLHALVQEVCGRASEGQSSLDEMTALFALIESAAADERVYVSRIHAVIWSVGDVYARLCPSAAECVHTVDGGLV